MKKIPLLVAILGGILPATATVTNTVTTLNDSGSGSLRSAILSANTNRDSVIVFATNGIIPLSSPLPYISQSVLIDGTTAPGYSSNPVVEIQFNGKPGITVAKGASGSTIKGLSLVGALSAAVTLQVPKVTLQSNFIGLGTDGAVHPNYGDGIKILASSSNNVIGNVNPVSSVNYTNDTDPSQFPFAASVWQGLRNYRGSSNSYLICGTAGKNNGVLYVGPVNGGGVDYIVNIAPTNLASTSVYGPDNVGTNGQIRLVGAYKTNGSSICNYGFVWDGSTSDLSTTNTSDASKGNFRIIAYPGAKYQFTHSTMGDLAVGNAELPNSNTNAVNVSPGIAYICDLSKSNLSNSSSFTLIPTKGLGAKSITAYGIWDNGVVVSTNGSHISSSHIYTICGGHSPIVANNLTNPSLPLTLAKAFLVDYDAITGKFSNWTTFTYPNNTPNKSFISHFEGISSTASGVYSLCGQSVEAGSPNVIQGSWVTVQRNSDGTFGQATWQDLNYPSSNPGTTYISTSGNSVYGNIVVGIVVGTDSNSFAYQSTVLLNAQRANVIGGNKGNGITLDGSAGNIIAMNYIGTDPTGSTDQHFGNHQNGLLITGNASRNLVGGQIGASNDPTSGIFQRPPLGNLISGNHGNGVLINNGAKNNTLSGNYIGTDATGTNALGNWSSGVVIENANSNSLIGCGLYQSPFVYYNVISGNEGHGVVVNNSSNITVQANFLGIDALNSNILGNCGDGLLISGSSKNIQVGGIIPLGNVASGNDLNGVEIKDKASYTTNFNTFGGFGAFGTNALPNGLDGILITSTGGNNTVKTCLLGGNLGNGVEIGGDASGVQVTEVAAGTDSLIIHAIPNQCNGIVLSGTAHNNAIGGFQPSIEPHVYASGNKGYGIAVLDHAYNNSIFHTSVGSGTFFGLAGPLPNDLGGIYLDQGTYGTTIGGPKAAFANDVNNSTNGDGITMISSSKNSITNTLVSNNAVGIYADGNCAGTIISTNGVRGNIQTNLDVATATGIILKP